MAQMNLITSQTRPWIFLIALLCGLYPATGNSSMQDIKVSTAAEISTFFDQQDKTVLTFSGYSGSGYEDPEAMLQHARSTLETFDPQKTIINIGATKQGIGAVYQLAREMGFTTTGIASILARKNNVEFSPCVDYIFLVEDDSWGGLVGDTGQLSPTSAAIVNVSDVIVGIGGGIIGGEEMAAARQQGKTVRFFPADMNHRMAIEKARKKGLAVPAEFAGAAAGML
jgi:hypothetical protein